MESKKERLLNLIKKKALKFGNVTLSSGKTSDWYVDLRLITLDPEGAYLTAELLFDLLKDENIDALGGLTLGADPICGAFATISYQHKKPTPTFIVRKEAKEHGQMRSIEGPLKKGSKVVIVDDVATTGSSLLKAVEAAEKEGCRVAKIITIIDREEGAKEKLAERGYSLISLFSRKDFL